MNTGVSFRSRSGWSSWFKPGACRGCGLCYPGFFVASLERPWLLGAARAVMVLGGGAYTALFYLSIPCNEGSIPTRSYLMAGVGCTVFWLLSIWALSASNKVLRWNTAATGQTEASPESRGWGSGVHLSALQKLMRHAEINSKMDTRLLYWQRICQVFLFSCTAFFMLVGATCIELRVRDRSHPERLSPVAAELAEFLPERTGGDDEHCLSAASMDTLLVVAAVFYMPAGSIASFNWYSMLMAVGLSAALGADHVGDLRRVIDADTWPWVSRRSPVMIPLRYWLFTPELQCLSSGKRRILQGLQTGNAWAAESDP